MVDLKKLEELLDKALEKETKETWEKRYKKFKQIKYDGKLGEH